MWNHAGISLADKRVLEVPRGGFDDMRDLPSVSSAGSLDAGGSGAGLRECGRHAGLVIAPREERS